MKRNMCTLMLVAMLGAVFALTLVGCAEEEAPVSEEVVEPPPAGEVMEEVPEGFEESYDEDEQEPGMEDLPPPTEGQVEQEPPIGENDDDTAPPDDM
ncbi:MAG: hypothetical protein ACOCX2_08355 [Armatimonadota bacterium]